MGVGLYTCIMGREHDAMFAAITNAMVRTAAFDLKLELVRKQDKTAVAMQVVATMVRHHHCCRCTVTSSHADSVVVCI